MEQMRISHTNGSMPLWGYSWTSDRVLPDAKVILRWLSMAVPVWVGTVLAPRTLVSTPFALRRTTFGCMLMTPARQHLFRDRLASRFQRHQAAAPTSLQLKTPPPPRALYMRRSALNSLYVDDGRLGLEQTHRQPTSAVGGTRQSRLEQTALGFAQTWVWRERTFSSGTRPTAKLPQ